MNAAPGPPKDHQSLIERIHDDFEAMSRTSKKIAAFLTENPNDVAMLSVNKIARRCGIHASSFVRFAQSMGYSGFKDLQAIFHERLSTAAPGYDARVRALQGELHQNGGSGAADHLRRLVARDIASLENLLGDVDAADLDRAAALVDRADTTFLVSQQRAEPVTRALFQALTHLGQRVLPLGAAENLAPQAVRTAGPRDVLIAIAFRPYGDLVVDVARAAYARGVPVLAISDSTLSPLAKSASVLFTAPEHDDGFPRSLAAPLCLAQALALALCGRIKARAAVSLASLATDA